MKLASSAVPHELVPDPLLGDGVVFVSGGVVFVSGGGVVFVSGGGVVFVSGGGAGVVTVFVVAGAGVVTVFVAVGVIGGGVATFAPPHAPRPKAAATPQPRTQILVAPSRLQVITGLPGVLYIGRASLGHCPTGLLFNVEDGEALSWIR